MTTSRARVAYAELRALSAPMAQPVGNAHRQWPQRAGLLLRLVDEEGAVGLGEAAPLPGYSADELADCAAHLQRVNWSALDLEVDEIRGEVGGLLGFAPATARELARLPRAARCAAETALLTLVACRRAVPLATLLRGEPPPAAVPVSALLVGESPAALLASGRAALARGFSTLKIKIGRPDGAAWELAALQALRQQLGPAVALRLDANRAWSLAEATARLAPLVELAPELVEEPLADARELPRLRTPLPIALDESLQHLDPAAEVAPLLAAGAARALCLKPMALGGPLRCLQLARLAAAQGAPAFCTHLFDGTVALAAAAALALALPLPLACGLDAHPGLALGPAAALQLIGAPLILPPTAPGLGPELAAAPLTAPCLWSSAPGGAGPLR